MFARMVFMPPIFDSIIMLLIILIVARFIKRRSIILQRLFIPSSLVAGAIGLILGPQILATLPVEITDYWAIFPKNLINIVFAGLFLGKHIPSIREIWRMAGPMVAFGNTLAWGQYVVGSALAIFILTPFFGANPLVGALIEISFEGGHGTAAGLAPTFEKLGWAEGTDIALGIATLSIITAIASGVILINLYNRKQGNRLGKDEFEQQRLDMIRSGYDLVSLSRKLDTNPKAILINIVAFLVSIGLGWVLLQGLILLEDLVLRPFTDLRFFIYVPLFPLAMIGGLLVQLFLKSINRQKLIKRRTTGIISTFALDLLIASAIATVSLNVIGNNFFVFLILSIAGMVWILGAFIFLAPRMFPSNWFENGITNMGQSMGMTATGLLLNRLIDPANKVRARESFAYKQLLFEPFMGGGLITATSVVIIYEFGLLFALITSCIVTVFWLLLGLFLGRKK